MPFRRASSQSVEAGGAAQSRSRVAAGLLFLTRAILSLVTLCILALALLYLRLLQGPVELATLTDLVEEQVGSFTDAAQVSLGTVVLTLDDSGGHSGLQFRDVEVTDPDGARIFAIPVVTARFRLGDLLHGLVRPVSVTLIEPETRVVRDASGRLSVGIGGGRGLAISNESETSRGTSETFRAFSDFFAGDSEPVPELARLEQVDIIGARFSFDDRRGGTAWSTSDASIRMRRGEDRAELTLTIDTIDEGTPGAALRLFAERRRGEDTGRVRVAFGNFRPRDLSEQLPGLDWLRLLEGTVEGQATAFVNIEGRVTGVEGILIAEDGRVLGQGPESRFDFIELHFKADPARETLALSYASVDAPALGAAMSGQAELRRAPDGTFSGLAGQFGVDRLRVDLPEVFSETLTFDDGQMTFRWDLGANHVEIADGRLADGPLVFAVDGQARAVDGDWVADVRAEAEGMTIADLLEHWPLAAAKNARTWVADNIHAAQIPSLLAQMRFGQGDPYVSLDFVFAEMFASYIDGMTPIEQASGRGHMTFNDLYLDFARAEVTPEGRPTITLGGSRVAITEFWGEVTPADIDIVAEGEAGSVLNLIDQQPLSLVSKLGLDLNRIGGLARVVTRVAFPLISDLRLDDIEAAADAELVDVATTFPLGEGRAADVTSPGLKLSANTQEMRLTGPVVAGGARLNFDWREVYGGTEGRRTIALSGQATGGFLGLIGAAALPVEGEVPFKASLKQTGAGPLDFELDANLERAAVSVAALDWTKPPGAAGRLRATGGFDRGLKLSTFDLETDALVARGRLEVTPEGELREARFDRLRFRDEIDVAAVIGRGEGGALDVLLSDGEMDLRRWTGDDLEQDGGQAEESDPTPVRVRFDLRRLRIGRKLVLAPARGQTDRDATGRVRAQLSGSLGGVAPVDLAVDAYGGVPGTLKLTSSDAGAALGAAGLYEGARGGRLVLNATLSADDDPTISGQMVILDIRVRSEATFRRVLRHGGLDQAEQEISSSGISFGRVEVPFVYDGRVITLEDALATGPALALKVSGTVDEESNQVALNGVLSPAYGLTGALDNIPVLREIFSGGRGEGVLAMTFSMQGPIEDPDITVNPLSILAPGFLRNIFTRKSGTATDSSELEERFKPEDR